MGSARASICGGSYVVGVTSVRHGTLLLGVEVTTSSRPGSPLANVSAVSKLGSMDLTMQETVDYVAVRRLQDSYADIVTRRRVGRVPRHLRARHRRRHRHPQGRLIDAHGPDQVSGFIDARDRTLRLLRVRHPQRAASGCVTTATTTARSGACTSPSSGARRAARNGRRRTACTTTASRGSTAAGGSRVGGTTRSRHAARRRRVRVPDRRPLLSDPGSAPPRRAGGVLRAAGSNSGRLRPSDSSSQVTCTGMPTVTASGGQPTMFVMSRGPSSSSTSATTYGSSPNGVGIVGPVLDEARVDRAGAPTPAATRARVAEAPRAHLAREPDRRVARGAPLEQQPLLAGRVPERLRSVSETGGSNGPLRRSHGVLTASPPCRARRSTCTTAPARPVRDRDLGAVDLARRRTRRAAAAPPRRAGTSRTCRGGCTRARRRSCSSAARRPAPCAPSSTNAPPSPFAQNPRSSRCSSTVMVKES